MLSRTYVVPGVDLPELPWQRSLNGELVPRV